MQSINYAFTTSDNRRIHICTVTVQTKNWFTEGNSTRNWHARYNLNRNRNTMLNENTINRMIRGVFSTNTIAKFSRQDNLEISFVVMKKKSTYYINGDKISGRNLNKLINYIFVKFRAYKNRDEIDDDIIKFQEIDPLITDVIINKLKYKYYSFSSGRFEETLLNMQIIGKDTVAFEFYSDKWIPFSFKEAIQFIRACMGGENKFMAMPFQELYYKATGKFLSNSEEKLIDAFLLQNRSSNLVTKRSMELVEKLTTFPAINRVNILNPMGNSYLQRGLHIRGIGASWVVTHQHEDGQHVLGRQNVRTQMLVHLCNLVEDNTQYAIINENGSGIFSVGEGTNAYTDGKNYYILGGSICIDQMDFNISLGDQIASRSLLLMSDVNNLDKVSTLRGMGSSMGLPRNKEVIEDGLLTLRPVELTTKILRRLSQ